MASAPPRGDGRGHGRISASHRHRRQRSPASTRGRPRSAARVRSGRCDRAPGGAGPSRGSPRAARHGRDQVGPGRRGLGVGVRPSPGGAVSAGAGVALASLSPLGAPAWCPGRMSRHAKMGARAAPRARGRRRRPAAAGRADRRGWLGEHRTRRGRLVGRIQPTRARDAAPSPWWRGGRMTRLQGMLTTPQANPKTPHRLDTVLGGTVVVGFDGSPPAARALELVAKALAPSGVLVVAAVDPDVHSRGLLSEPLLGPDLDTDAWLTAARDRLRDIDPPFRVETIAGSGDPGQRADRNRPRVRRDADRARWPRARLRGPRPARFGRGIRGRARALRRPRRPLTRTSSHP